MKQKRAKNKLGIIITVFVLLLILSVISFPVPGTDYTFNGFIGSLNKSLDYTGGTVLNFSVTDNSGTNEAFKEGVASHLTRIENLLNDNYYNCNAYINGDYIAVELIGDEDPLDISQMINADFSFYITTTDSDTAEKIITSADVTTCYAMQEGSTIGLYIGFTEDGASALSAATSSGSATLYFTIGDKSLQVSVSQALTQDYITITMSSYSTTEAYAAIINASRFDYSFAQVSSVVITEKQAIINAITTAAVAVALIILAAVLMISLFKKLGWIAMLSILFGLILQIIVLQSIPSALFSPYAFVGFVVTFALALLAEIYVFGKMHEEYKIGKKLYASIQFGFNKSYFTVIDGFVVVLISSLLFFAFGSYELKSFALPVALGAVTYPLAVLLLNKWFIGWYLLLNPTNAKKYGFSRKEGVNELA